MKRPRLICDLVDKNKTLHHVRVNLFNITLDEGDKTSANHEEEPLEEVMSEMHTDIQVAGTSGMQNVSCNRQCRNKTTVEIALTILLTTVQLVAV